MANKVHLNVTAGPMKGKAFSFDEHDTFLFGRVEECHCRQVPRVSGARSMRTALR